MDKVRKEKKVSSFKLIVSSRNDAIGISNSYLLEYCKKKGFEIIYLKKKFGIFSEILNFIYLFFKLKKNDTVLFTDPHEIVTNVIFFKKIENPYIICYHIDEDPLYYKLVFGFLSIKKLLHKFNKIIAISDFTKNQLVNLGFPSKKICVVYLGLDSNKFFIEKEKRNYKYILVVGSENHRKNMKNILLTFSKLQKKYPDLKLIKVGRVNSDNREKTMKYLNEFKIPKNKIIFYDDIPTKKLRRLYSSAEMLLFPSTLEGFGFPIIEAMACGCPVVTSNISPMKDLQNNKSLLVNPYDTNSIYDACAFILDNPKLRQKAIELGLKRAKDFSWNTTLNSIYNIIKK
jgi:glycosyltransferase involved in cell wall biosynthesis